jgi:hypothetical protein
MVIAGDSVIPIHQLDEGWSDDSIGDRGSGPLYHRSK